MFSTSTHTLWTTKRVAIAENVPLECTLQLVQPHTVKMDACVKKCALEIPSRSVTLASFVSKTRVSPPFHASHSPPSGSLHDGFMQKRAKISRDMWRISWLHDVSNVYYLCATQTETLQKKLENCMQNEKKENQMGQNSETPPSIQARVNDVSSDNSNWSGCNAFRQLLVPCAGPNDGTAL